MKRLTIESPAVYRIRVQGVLDQSSTDHLQAMEIFVENDGREQSVTVLTSRLSDQAALLGALTTLYNVFHLPLLSVECLAIGGE